MSLDPELVPLRGQTTAFTLEGMDQTDGTAQLVLDVFDATPEELQP